MKLLTVIKSCHRNVARRDACADTWLPYLQMDWVFLIGNPTPANGGPALVNTLPLNAPDDFENIGPKIHYACDYAYCRGVDYLFVCDDDTYVHPDRLMAAVPNGLDYVGWYRSTGHPALGFAPYIQGSAYWLSRLAMEYVLKCNTMLQKGPDDCLLGAALWHKVSFTHDGRYRPGPLLEVLPERNNDVITVHKCLPKSMQDVHTYVSNWVNRCEN